MIVDLSRAVDASGAPAGMTVTQIVIAGVATVVVLVAALVLVLSASERRGRRRGDSRRAAPPPSAGLPGYGRPPGYGPPPLWDDTRRDPPAPLTGRPVRAARETGNSSGGR